MGLIEIKNLCKIYGEGQENEVRALDGVNLSIDYGEFVAIVGASGSGKSTMMNILGCLDVPTRGTYLLDGISISQRTERELAQIRSRKISFIFQGYNLIPSLNVWKNVALPMAYQGIAPQERYQKALKALDDMGIAGRAEAKPTVLSGGQQQRVAIARAIATASPIIMADEPTGALDSKTGAQVINILRSLHRQGTTIILITHDNGIAAKANRIVRLQDGKIIHDAPNIPDENRPINENM
ncbi:MAG: ABC transporter ATP-binding protein [Butyricicoccaceae bacterium]